MLISGPSRQLGLSENDSQQSLLLTYYLHMRKEEPSESGQFGGIPEPIDLFTSWT